MTSDGAVSLRQAIASSSSITFANNGAPCDKLVSASHIDIAGELFPKSTPTRFRKLDVKSPSAPSDFYTLEALYLVWRLKEASAAEYSKQARENGVLITSAVGVTARRAVLEWLEGKVGDGDYIQSATGASSGTPPGSPKQSSQQSVTSPKKHAPDTPSTSSKRRYVPDAHDLEAVKKIRKGEIELRDRIAVLQGAKANDFTAIKNIYTDRLKKMREGSRSAPAATAAAASTLQDMKMQARKSRTNFPIIIVSSSPTSLVTMHNVKRFLQDAVFESPQEARERGGMPEKLVTIDRRHTHMESSGREVVTQSRYIVMDSHESLNKFGPDAWDRVVCVMTTGQAWQFKPYRWSEPRTLFHHVKGIHFSWASDAPNPKIKDWNVSELKIDQGRRHVDKSVVAQFWKLLDTWMMANKPGLMSK